MLSEVTTYVDYGKFQLSEAHRRAAALLKTAPSVALEVAEGPQKNSFTVLEADQFNISNGLDADLFFASIEGAEQVEVKATKTLLGLMITVETPRSDVFLDGRQVESRAGPVRAPCRLAVGDNIVEINAELEPYRDVRSPQSRVMMLGGASLVFVAGLLAAFLMAPSGAPTVQLGTITTAEVEVIAPDDAMRKASALIEGIGLGSVVDVASPGNNTILVSGSLSESQADLWTELQPVLDSVLSDFTVMRDVTVRPGITELPAVGVAILGDRPSLIMASGAYVMVGETVTGDWKLVEVSRDGFMLDRDGETVFVRYE